MVEGWNETGWVFRGDAELAQERGLAGVCLWKDGTFCFGGTPNWRIARFDWDVFVEGRDFCFEGTRNWRIARFRWMCL